MPYADAEKQKEAQKRHYEQNKKRYAENLKRRRQQRRKWLVEYKSTLSCETCGENHPAVLDFHHKNDDKELGVSESIHYNTVERVLKEIKKCVVLCSNCHRKWHWNKKNHPEYER